MDNWDTVYEKLHALAQRILNPAELEHAQAVASNDRMLSGSRQKSLAIVHDLIEDYGEDAHDQIVDVVRSCLKESGADRSTTDTVVELFMHDLSVLTRAKNQEYVDYIDAIVESGRFDPLMVKLADLEHNISRSVYGSRRSKYIFTYRYLASVLYRNFTDSTIQKLLNTARE